MMYNVGRYALRQTNCQLNEQTSLESKYMVRHHLGLKIGAIHSLAMQYLQKKYTKHTNGQMGKAVKYIATRVHS